MLTGVKLTPKLFFRMFFYGLLNRPVFNSFALGLPVLIVVFLHGWVAGVFTAASIAVVLGLVFAVVSIYMYFTYRNRYRQMPVSYKVDSSTIRIYFGDRNSAHVHTTILRKQNTSKAWVFGRGIYVRHNSLTRCLMISDSSRTKFIAAMKKAGWFALPKPSIKERFMTVTKHAGAVAATGLIVFAAFPVNPEVSPTVSGQTPAAALQPSDVFDVVNDKRTTMGHAPLGYDEKLALSAARACNDMTTYKFYGSENPATGRKGYDYIREYYADRWIVEVSLPITGKYTAEQVASRWIDNSGADGTVLDKNYTIGAVAKCDYTADNKFDKVIVLHLAS